MPWDKSGLNHCFSLPAASEVVKSGKELQSVYNNPLALIYYAYIKVENYNFA